MAEPRRKCGHCGLVLDAGSFYPSQPYRCKVCHRLYLRARYHAATPAPAGPEPEPEPEPSDEELAAIEERRRAARPRADPAPGKAPDHPVHGPYREHHDTTRVPCGGGYRVLRKSLVK